MNESMQGETEGLSTEKFHNELSPRVESRNCDGLDRTPTRSGSNPDVSAFMRGCGHLFDHALFRPLCGDKTSRGL